MIVYYIIFVIFFILLSAFDILAIIFSGLYLSNCQLTSNQQITLSIIISCASYTILRRFFIISGNYKVNNNNSLSCGIICKSLIFILPSLIIYIGNLLFYNKLNLDLCNNIKIDSDKLYFILIGGLIECLMEMNNLYNIWKSIIRNNRILPDNDDNDVNDDNIEIITHTLKDDIINKINNLNYINQSLECNICLDNNNIIKLDCNHIFHKECIIKWINQDINTSNKCPTCRQII
jgi:hypothetical protein